MSVRISSPSVSRFIRQQQLYVFIVVAVAAVFWATQQPINPAAVILYALCIGNLITPALERTRRLYFGRPFPYNRAIFLAALTIYMLPVYALSTVVVDDATLVVIAAADATRAERRP
jgi:hypothetical protein